MRVYNIYTRIRVRSGETSCKVPDENYGKTRRCVYRMPCVSPRADFPAEGLKRWSAGKDSERGRPRETTTQTTSTATRTIEGLKSTSNGIARVQTNTRNAQQFLKLWGSLCSSLLFFIFLFLFLFFGCMRKIVYIIIDYDLLLKYNIINICKNLILQNVIYVYLSQKKVGNF